MHNLYIQDILKGNAIVYLAFSKYLNSYMEEMESPVEKLQDEITEMANEEKEQKKNESWTMGVALSTSIIAVLAAITGLLAGKHANDALIYQVKASDQWSYYQAKGIKYDVEQSAAKIIEKVTQGKTDTATVSEALRYKKEKEDIKKKAERFEEQSNRHLETHETLARSVTLFQIAIAISAIAILTRKKYIWYISLVLAVAGMAFFIAISF